MRRRTMEGGSQITSERGSLGVFSSVNLVAVELLKGCGMIRRSEKRRLVVREAPVSRYLDLSVYECQFRGCDSSLHTGNLPNGCSAKNSFSVQRNVIPLLNPIWKTCV